MDIKPGDVLFVWGKGIVQEVIQDVTHGPSHVAIFKDSQTLIEAQAGRVVGETPLSFYQDGHTRCELWRDYSLTDGQRQQLIEYAYTLYGIPYDYVLIPLEALHYETGLPIDWYHEHKHLICSSLVYDVANSQGLKWGPYAVCAPVDEMTYGVLQKQFDLQQPSAQAAS